MKDKMKAALWDGKGLLEVCEVDKPLIGPKDALVKVKSSGICGSDLLIYADKNEAETLPQGHEIAGEVVDVGVDVEKQIIGTRVAIEGIGHGKACLNCYYCNAGQYFLCEDIGIERGGGYAEYVVTKAQGLYPIANSMNWDEAGLVEPYAVALHAIRRGELSGGETVAVLGSGTIGLCTIAAARAMGAGHIIATARYPQQDNMARMMGADMVVTSEGDVLNEALLDYSNGTGSDLTIETVGGRSDAVITQAVDVTRKQGRIVTTGNFYTPIQFDWMKAILKEHSVIWSATYATTNGRNEFQIAIEQMGSKLVDLNPLVTHRFPLSEIQKGLDTSFDKNGGAIKVQIQSD